MKLFDTLDLAKVPDGTYTAASQGYETLVEVEVKVAGGRIAAVRVIKHHEKQYYSSLTETPAQIVQKQSVKNVDAVSGATITSEAIINATAKAVHGAMK
ncbi:MAG: FMN-binding protein [Verrucomicrobiota bacterium]